MVFRILFNIQAFLSFFFLAIGVFLFSDLFQKTTSLPSLLKIFSPREGLWQSYERPLKKSQKFSQLQSRVTVQIDTRGVPHVFASHSKDLYFVQGYIQASQRLFQMEILSRSGGGELSEILGLRAKDLDEYRVRIGMRRAARKSLKTFMSNDLSRSAVTAYVDGVNAFIESIDEKNLPPEYKILNITPRKYEPIHVAYILKMVSLDLSGVNHDLELTRLLHKYGDAKLKDLIPLYPDSLVPVIKRDELPPSLKGSLQKPVDFSFVSRFKNYPRLFSFTYLDKPPGQFDGSNSWAVHKSRTKNGNNLLSNDTHLSHSLPSIWYEIQLSLKDFSVYGASFPGTPGVLLGTNNHIAWGTTTAPVDVFDWYEVEFADETLDEYFYRGEKKKTIPVSETIRVRGKENIHLDQRWTDFGPISWQKDRFGLVSQWKAQDSGNEMLTFLKLNKAKTFEDCVEAFETFEAPAQHFTCSDREKIGLLQAASVPVKKAYQGAVIHNVDYVWSQLLSNRQLPHVFEPTSGLLTSANQHPTGSGGYKHYQGWYFADDARAQSINEVLKPLVQQKNVTVEDFIDLQYDITDFFAREVAPILVGEVDRELLSSRQKEILKSLSQWDYKVKAESILASVFYTWWTHLKKYIWTDQLWEGHGRFMPPDHRTVSLIKRMVAGKPHPLDLFWWKNEKKIKVETQTNPEKSKEDSESERVEGGMVRTVITEQLLSAWRELEERYGPDPDEWFWYLVNKASIPHLLKFPGWGREPFKMDGSRNSVSVTRGAHGAAWQMVVEMGEPITLWTRVLGGNSGNILSHSYGASLSEEEPVPQMTKAIFLLEETDSPSFRTSIFEAIP